MIYNLTELEKKGGEVSYFSADVSDKDAMEEVFEYTFSKYGKLDGIIHAAAATKDKSISVTLNETSIAELQEQFEVKVKGALIVSELVKKYKTKFVMLTSSTSSVLGGLGFGCYAASNVFVNSFVQEMNREGAAEWISLIWDGWYFPEYSDSMNETPRESTIKSEDGEKILAELNNAYETDQIIISKRNINKEIEKWLGGFQQQENKQEVDKTINIKERPFLVTSYKKPETDIQAKLCKIWEDFFGIDIIGIEDHFYELGGDSLKATSIVSIIHKRLGIRIPLTADNYRFEFFFGEISKRRIL